MTDRKTQILDVTEEMVRQQGYNGFSFRDIAARVNVKSASVHYHFPTKNALLCALARRYLERFETELAQARQSDHDLVATWRGLFRQSYLDDGKMCLCGMLGAESAVLSAELREETAAFFDFAIKSLQEVLETEAEALRVISTLEGAIILARVKGDIGYFDRATAHLCG